MFYSPPTKKSFLLQKMPIKPSLNIPVWSLINFHWLRRPRAKKAHLPSMVTLQPEVQGAAHHSWGSCIRWPWRCPDPLPETGQLPHIGCHKISYHPGLLASFINENWKGQTRNLGKSLLGPQDTVDVLTKINILLPYDLALVLRFTQIS